MTATLATEAGVLAPGDEIAPGYVVVEHVRRGADLDCYEVWSRERFCRCFAKAPRPDRADRAATLRHLRREARLLCRFSHPHLVRGYEWCPDRSVLITENLTGATLSYLLGEYGRLGAGDLAQLGLHLCSALRYLHGRGVLHLDVKPGNVVAADGVAKLIDLSLARSVNAGRCAPGYGTVGYLSPEQLLGARVTEAADVWGLGLVLYEAATAVRPFSPASPAPRVGESRTSRRRVAHSGAGNEPPSTFSELSAMSSYEARLVRPVKRLRYHRRLPVPVAGAVDACLSLRPADRPGLAELAEALETLV